MRSDFEGINEYIMIRQFTIDHIDLIIMLKLLIKLKLDFK